MRFALLSSVIYLSLPTSAHDLRSSGYAAASARFAEENIPGVKSLHVTRQMHSFGTVIGFDTRGFDKLRFQLSHVKLPSASERTRVSVRLGGFVKQVKKIVSAGDKAGDVIALEIRKEIGHQEIFVTARESLDRLAYAADSLRTGAHALVSN